MFEDLIADLREPAADLLQAAGEARLAPRITSTRRSRAAQERLYRRWKSGLSPFPAAPPGLSAHEYGYAFDMVLSPWEALADAGYTWQQWGGIWGGEKDPVHFEYPGFVAPSVEPPWWFEVGTLALPTKAVDILDTPAAKNIIAKGIYSPTLCKLFGILC